MLAPELIARIKAIQIRTRHAVTDVLAGDYESAFKGRGMEFEEVREYQPGDDVRHIDWNVTARMNAPFLKVHREERELTVMLLVDMSSSGAFGSVDRLKSEVAAEVAAILAYTAVQEQRPRGAHRVHRPCGALHPGQEGLERSHLAGHPRDPHLPRRAPADAACDVCPRVLRQGERAAAPWPS